MSFILKVTSINLITSSKYMNSINTDCTICRCDINSDSIYAKDIGNRSIISTGMCGHMFHDECIKPWPKNNSKCPICIKSYNIIILVN